MYETPEPGSEWEGIILSIPQPIRTWIWEMDKGYPRDIVALLAEERYRARVLMKQDGFYEDHVKSRLEEFWQAEKNSRAKIEKTVTEGPEPRWYFATFTQPDSYTKNPEQILKNTRKIIRSRMVDPITWCYSLELMKNGAPHTHCAFYTAKYPEFKKVGKFNVSDTGVPWRYDISGARYPEAVNHYVLKTETKPDAEWLKAHDQTQAVWLADNFPPELIPPNECPMSPGGPNIR